MTQKMIENSPGIFGCLSRKHEWGYKRGDKW